MRPDDVLHYQVASWHTLYTLRSTILNWHDIAYLQLRKPHRKLVASKARLRT
jgi:hypothetical protein